MQRRRAMQRRRVSPRAGARVRRRRSVHRRRLPGRHGVREHAESVVRRDPVPAHMDEGPACDRLRSGYSTRGPKASEPARRQADRKARARGVDSTQMREATAAACGARRPARFARALGKPSRQARECDGRDAVGGTSACRRRADGRGTRRSRVRPQVAGPVIPWVPFRARNCKVVADCPEDDVQTLTRATPRDDSVRRCRAQFASHDVQMLTNRNAYRGSSYSAACGARIGC